MAPHVTQNNYFIFKGKGIEKRKSYWPHIICWASIHLNLTFSCFSLSPHLSRSIGFRFHSCVSDWYCFTTSLIMIFWQLCFLSKKSDRLLETAREILNHCRFVHSLNKPSRTFPNFAVLIKNYNVQVQLTRTCWKLCDNNERIEKT